MSVHLLLSSRAFLIDKSLNAIDSSNVIMVWQFSDAFRALAESRMGAGWLDSYFENIYLEQFALGKTKPVVEFRWQTGRPESGSRYEDPSNIFKYYNDLRTVPSQDTIKNAKQFFTNLVDGIHSEDQRVKKIARWVNEKTVYKYDSERWGKAEFWSSPFDLWQQYLAQGRIEDDCDGSAALILWACTLIGVSPKRLYMWVGNAVYGRKREGHANVLYFSLDRPAAHVEGSWFPDLNQANWLGEVWQVTQMYQDTRFIFNRDEVRILW